ncbi:glycosyltransferase WbsX family protein [Holdemanella porci]|uniref:glycosyltransferase WbsX family protein n=1 Tax=Holdemanella porci TaxID=2652276 RepID=UPI003F909BB4
MKKIAFYLPQYHSIPENDEWWGKGFTEWVNVKKAEPQFKGHVQPEIPLDNNYYSLMDEKWQEKQSDLALRYGIDGFCYYHYWFEGKLLLEKPMEKMLKNKNVKIPFCICWANETWARTWDGAEKDILIEQNYNEDVNAWKTHFDYLNQFFKDKRYICHKNKPILIIYKPYLIKNCKEMLEYWRKLALETGLDGLYIGYQHHSCFDYNMESLGFDFGIQFEPFYTVREFKNQTKSIFSKLQYCIKKPNYIIRKIKQKMKLTPTIYDYDAIWNMILKRDNNNLNIVYPGAFTSWDNTPRRGKDSNVFYKSTPKKFKNYFYKLVKKYSGNNNSDYIFINAWNEWAEGAHLEPDEVNKYGYLEAIRSVNDLK